VNCLLENIRIKKYRKYKPPIHCEEDLQSISVGSKYLIFSNIEKPVVVRPEKLSNKALIKEI
tara:strand:+ start:122 stop:307 length:186 start_codon:yes stop_codon:yes gene_type:complete